MDVSRPLDFRIPAPAPRLLALAATASLLIPSSAQAQFGDEYWWDGFRLPGTSTAVLDHVEWNDLTVMVGGFYGANEETFLRIAGWNGSSFVDVGGGIGCTDVFDPCVQEDAIAVTVFEGDLVVAGLLSEAPGITISNVARFDGSTWTAMGDGFDGAINDLVVHDGILYAGGDFTTVSGSDTAYLTRWTGTDWEPIPTGPDDDVNALASWQGTLAVGGEFTTVNGQAAGYVATFDGTTWSPLGTGFDDDVRTLLVDDQGVLHAGGDFELTDGFFGPGIALWNGEGWSPVGGGIPGEVFAIESYQGQIVAAGDFSFFGGSRRGVVIDNLTILSDDIWFSLGDGTGGRVESLHAVGSSLYVSGAFTRVGLDVKVASIAEWDGELWTPLGPPGGEGLDDYANALAVHDGQLVIGGDFLLGGDGSPFPAEYVATWDGTSVEFLGTEINGPVLSLLSSGGSLYAAGNFTFATFRDGDDGPAGSRPDARGGISRGVGIFNESITAWFAFGEGFDTGVNVIHDHDGTIVVGGPFTLYDGVTPTGAIAQWNGTNFEELGGGLTGGPGTEVTDLATFEGDLIAVGDFTSAGGTTVSSVARWNGTTWDDMGWSALGDVLAVEVVNGELYMGGRFFTGTGAPGNYLVRWNGSAWGPIPAPVNGVVQTLSSYENKLLVSGTFGRGGTEVVHRLGLWTGTTWETLGSGLQTPAFDAANYRGDLYVAGPFTRIGEGRTSAHLARWQDPTPEIETHVVTSLDDAADANPGDGICADAFGNCTLRAALEEANASTGVDTVTFEILGGGPYVISPFIDLPPLIEGVVIDGTTVDDFDGVPLVVVDGSSADGSGLGIVVQGTDSTVRGLALTGWNGDALTLAGSGGHTVTDTYVGVAPAGASVGPNFGRGIVVESATNLIERCVVAGNAYGSGVVVDGVLAADTEVRDSAIGLDGEGVPVANGTGITINAAPRTVITRCVIGGNGNHGIAIFGSDPLATGTTITGCRIGVDLTGTPQPNGLDGIRVAGGLDTRIGGATSVDANEIAYNGGDGIAIPFQKSTESAGTTILRNRIYANGDLGIDLGINGVDGADDLDADSGPNGLQNAPTISTLTVQPDHAVASGTLLAMPDSTYTIEVFTSSACDGSGSGEAERFAGRGVVTADAAGIAAFDVLVRSPVTEGEVLTATATDAAGNTSEFSVCEPVILPEPVEPMTVSVLGEVMLPLDRYVLLGMPAYPRSGAPRVSAFLEGLGAYDDDRWRVFGVVDEPGGEYVEDPLLGPGQAYFLLSTEAADLAVTGVPRTYPTAVRLAPGWNAITAPAEGFEWGTCQVVRDDGRAAAFGSPDAEAAVASQACWYDDDTGNLVNDGDWRHASVDPSSGEWTDLPDSPYRGYVVYAYEACDFLYPSLDMLPRPARASGPLSVRVDLDVDGGDGVTVGLVNGEATSGWTVFRPPFVGDAGTTVRIVGHPDRLADYRVHEGAAVSWPVEVRTPGDVATLRVPRRELPSGWSVWLEDEVGDVVADLTTTDAVEVAVPPSGRRLSLVAAPFGPGEGPLVPSVTGIRGVRPAPVRAQATVSLDLARAGRITLEVFDVQGRRIETAYEGWLDAGRHDLVWSPGATVATSPGVVFLRLRGDGVAVSRKVAVIGSGSR